MTHIGEVEDMPDTEDAKVECLTATAEDATGDTDEPVADEPVESGEKPIPDGDTFPRSYVETLRKESATYRDRAKTADLERGVLAARLHLALVEATGRLADPHDLPYNPEHLDDPEALVAAIEELIAAKPHLKSRKPSGDVGQGVKGQPAQPSLLAMLKNVV
jgi:hypothetical protein